MKKHIVIALGLVIVFLVLPIGGPFLASAQTNTTLITQLQAQVAKLQAILLTLTRGSTPKPIEVSPSPSSISSLNNQIATKIGRLSSIELKSLLVQRKVEMLNLAKTNPRLFLTQKLSPTIIQQIPIDLQTNIEQSVSPTGRLEVIHVDDFENPENSRYDYSLVVGRDKYTLYPTQPVSSVSGAVLAVSGLRLGKILVVETEEANQFRILTPAPPPNSIGEQKTLVLLVDFLDSGPRPFTPDEAKRLVLGDNRDSPLNKFYLEQSYGKTWFTGDVKGWYTLPRNGPPEPCSVSDWSSELGNIVITNGINVENYDRLFILSSHPNNFIGCSSVGEINFLGSSMSIVWAGRFNFSGNWPFSWTWFDFLLAHEVGHGLGLNHANKWPCKDRVLYGNCQHFEYGNFFDIMGNSGLALHTNSFYKDLLGWISPDSLLNINKTGTYTLNPIELAGGKLAAKVNLIGIPDTFYLEYRQALGFDSGLNRQDLVPNQTGLFVNKIHFASDSSGLWYDHILFPYLLDMRPGDLPGDPNVSLNDSFSDEGLGLSIKIVEQSSDLITFNVSISPPVCKQHEPIIDFHYFYPSNLYRNPGFNGVVDFSILNNNSPSCEPSTFQIVPLLPVSWNYTSYSRSDYTRPDLTLGPGQWGSGYVDFTVPVNETFGVYPVSFKALSQFSGLNSTEKTIFNLNVGYQPVIYQIDPVAGPTGTSVKITGTSFSTSGNSISFSGSQIFTIRNINSPDGTTLSFNIPNNLPSDTYRLAVSTPFWNVPSNNDGIFTVNSSLATTVTPLPRLQPITPIAESVSIKTIENISPTDLVPIPIPPPSTTTAAIISPVIVIPTPTPVLSSLTASTPPNNAVDARDGKGFSFKIAVLTFSSDLGSEWNNLANWSVVSTQPQATATAPPSVASIAGSPYRPIVILSRNIVPGERVTIAHKPTGAKVCLGFLPGDVDQNGWALNSDISLLNSWIGTAEGASQLLYQTDINRDGVFDAKDVTRAGELLSSTTTPAIRSLPACPAPLTSVSSQSQLANVLAALRNLLQSLQTLLSR